MIDKSHLRTTMLALTGAELTQAHKTYERFLASARLDRSEPIENDEQAQAETAAVNGGVKPGHWAEQNPASTAGTQASAGRA